MSFATLKNILERFLWNMLLCLVVCIHYNNMRFWFFFSFFKNSECLNSTKFSFSSLQSILISEHFIISEFLGDVAKHCRTGSDALSFPIVYEVIHDSIVKVDYLYLMGICRIPEVSQGTKIYLGKHKWTRPRLLKHHGLVRKPELFLSERSKIVIWVNK